VTRVYLLRHAESVWNSEGRAQGQLESELSPRGQAQAARLARTLGVVPLRAVYSSPLLRAFDTAQAVADRHGLSVVTDPDLREIGLGAWEGLTSAQITERFGDMIVRRRRDPLGVVPPGGESLPDVQARVMGTLRTILGRHPDGTIAIVAHGAVNRVVLLSVLAAPLDSYWRLRQDNGAINIVEFDGARSWVRTVNETAHLADVDADPQR
jgi:broad specificity phosphatase PhoE